MVHMVALGAGGGHDGGIGDGGAVVTTHGAGHAGGDAHDGQRVIHGEHVLNDGNQHTEGAPAGTGGESQQAADDKHQRRQQHLHTLGAAPDKVPDKILGAQGVGHGLQAPGKGQDQDSRHHGLEALGDTAHHVPEGHGPAKHVVHESEHQSEGRAQHQSHGGVGIGKGVHEIGPGEETAGVDHADDTANHQHHDGQHQVQYPALVLLHFLIHHGIGVGPREQIAVFPGVVLKLLHQAEFFLHQHHTHHHDNGQNGVVVEGNGPDKEVQALTVLSKGGHGGGPGGDGSNDAHGGGSGVNDVGQLGPRNTVLVSHRPHDAAHGQTVEIVVNKDQDTQDDGGQLGAHPALDVLLGPTAEGGGAAGLVHQAYQGAQNHQEDQDTHIVAV